MLFAPGFLINDSSDFLFWISMRAKTLSTLAYELSALVLFSPLDWPHQWILSAIGALDVEKKGNQARGIFQRQDTLSFRIRLCPTRHTRQ